MAEKGDSPDVMVVPTGGGGMLAGCAGAISHLGRSISSIARVAPGNDRKITKLWSVEPQGYDDHAQSFASSDDPPMRQRIGLSGTPGKVKYPF